MTKGHLSCTAISITLTDTTGQGTGITGPSGLFRLGGVTVTLGGFLAPEGVDRTRNITVGIGSSDTAIPKASSLN